jgi:hypothetical protein
MKTPLEKTNRYLELFWLVITIFSIGLTIFTIVSDGWEYGKWYFLFPLLALGMYIFRRSFRKRYERKRIENNNGQVKNSKK